VTASAVIKEGGKSWFFVTADYAFGHQLEADATHFIKEQGGTVVRFCTISMLSGRPAPMIRRK
jgi:ABC-type branched-subunit amino acid transport system substrate-binding protein